LSDVVLFVSDSKVKVISSDHLIECILEYTNNFDFINHS
jgi:hypothetical protein